MKSFKSKLGIVAIVSAAIAASASASTVVITSGGSLQGGNGGGAFIATSQGGSYNGEGSPFYTFCMEHGVGVEYVTLGQTYYTRISTVSDHGGDLNNGTRALDPHTAAIYQEFRNNGSFGGTVSTSYDSGTSTAMQLAIWHFQGQTENDNQITAGSDAQDIVDWANALNPSSIGNVRVLQLWINSDLTGHAQDQLTLVPTPTAALAGFGTLAGVGMLGAVRRRRNSAN